MGNTVFYRQINEDATQIKWKDIFSEYKKKHDKKDFEYALAAGTSLNTATEETMLQKWRKPWLFYPLLKWGIALIILLYIVYYGLSLSGIGVSVPAIEQMTIIIPPLVVPVILMVLFWEMNIPRNISIYELFAVWLIGGLISLVSANIIFKFMAEGLPVCIKAPLVEEPAKLITAFFIILFFSKNKKIYGITGFIIGAAVGAGFGAFESVQYAFNAAQQITDTIKLETGELIGLLGTSMNSNVLHSQILRAILAVGGHTLYCAPYAAELARHSKDGKITLNSIFNLDFIGAFFISCLFHGLWDLDIITIPGEEKGRYIYLIILIIFIWIQALRILRKCLNQVVQIGAAASGGAALKHGAGDGATSFIEVHHVERNDLSSKAESSKQPSAASAKTGIRLVGHTGELKGVQWQANGEQVLLAGRDTNCGIRFSSGAKGVSGRHCSIQLTQFGWTVKDLGSTFGTYVSGNQKILPGTEVKLKKGDVISLGGNENTLIVDYL